LSADQTKFEMRTEAGPRLRHDKMAREKFTPKQEAFVLAYFETGNAAEVKRGELRRFYVKQVETALQNPFAHMSDEELVEFIQTEAADILPQLKERSKLKSVH
jgi:hypothetical protein